MSTAYHPQTDGQTERANRTMAEMLRAYVHPRQDDREEYLPLVEVAYNNSTQAFTKLTPFYLNYGRHPVTPISAALKVNSDMPAVEEWLQWLKDAQERTTAHIQHAQHKMKGQADKKPTAQIRRQRLSAPRQKGAEALRSPDQEVLGALHRSLPSPGNQVRCSA